MINPNFSVNNAEIAKTNNKTAVWLTKIFGSEWRQNEVGKNRWNAFRWLTYLLLGCLGSYLDGMSRLSVDKLFWSRREIEGSLKLCRVENTIHPLKYRFYPCEDSYWIIFIQLSLAQKTQVWINNYAPTLKSTRVDGVIFLDQNCTWADPVLHVLLTCCSRMEFNRSST